MTSDQAVDIAARLGTAIRALEAARDIVWTDDIDMALQRARRSLAKINVLLAREEQARTIERQIIDKANRR